MKHIVTAIIIHGGCKQKMNAYISHSETICIKFAVALLAGA